MKLLHDQESKGQWVWVLFVRTIGAVLFIAPLYLPILAYFNPNIDNIVVNKNDALVSGVGFFISAGGKQLGTILNNIGIIITNLTEKLTK